MKRTFTPYLFILPWLIALVVFIAYPFAASLYFSFCDFPPLQKPMLVGAANYVELAGDQAFHRSLGTTMIYAAVAIPLGVVLAVTLAMLLNSRIRGQTFYRVVFYLPHLVPTVAVAILWMWIFNPQFGLINILLKLVLSAVDWWTAACRTLPVAAGVVIAAVPGIILHMARGRWKVRWTKAIAAAAWPLSIAAVSVAGIATLNLFLNQAFPLDMKKLHAPGWLSDATPFPSEVPFAPPWALWGLIVMSMWGVGQMAVIYLAKLQDVPVELYEAADIDGASWWRKTWSITLPMVSPVILFNVVMAIIGTFQVFAEPYIMTGGGPEEKTRFVAMFIYDQAFQYQRVGYASAVAWVLFLVIVGLTLLAFRVSRRHVYYAGR